ncbi:MAG: hypothetical protein ACHQU0_03100 [Candidatus Paceibacteria bacterium]
MHTSKGPEGSLYPPRKLLSPGIAFSWEEMVARLTEDIRRGPKIIEVTNKRTKGGYEKIYTGTLTSVRLKKSKICLEASDLTIERIHLRKDILLSPLLFPDGSFFFKTHTANYTIHP